MIKTFAKVDPGPLRQEWRQFAVVERIRNAREQNRNQPVTCLLCRAILGDENLFARPIADAFWPDKYCASRTTAEGICEAGLKGFSWNEAPLVQPGFHPGVFQFVRNFFDRRFVGAVMGEENIETFHGRAACQMIRPGFPESRPKERKSASVRMLCKNLGKSVIPRGYARTGTTPDGKEGLKW
jgi:hypothetical protein